MDIPINPNPLVELTFSEMNFDTIREREEYWAKFESRVKPSTCLECHGTNLTVLNLSGEITEIPNGLTLRHVGTSIADVWPVPKMVIDVDGNVISKTTST